MKKQYSISWIMSATLAVGLIIALVPSEAARAACAPSADNGTVTQTVSVPASGTYRVWSRMTTTTASANSYMLDIDGGTCYTIGGATLPVNTLTWVDYQNGNTASALDIALTAGNHTFKMYGTVAGVGVDRVVLTADTSCVPSSTGYNCATPAGVTLQVSQTNNLANNATFSESLTDATGFPLANINDQNESTRWISSPADGGYMTADLGASYDLSKVSILWAGDTTKDYEIQTSKDNSTWTTATTDATNNTTPQLKDAIYATPVTARYVRIHMIDRWNSTYGNSIWEIGFYGTASVATPPALIGDINGDGHVNTLDLTAILTHDNTNYAPADLNHDGTVGAADLAILLAHWTW